MLEQLACDESVELNNLVASWQHAVWEQAVQTHPVDRLLEHVLTALVAMCCRLVTTCTFSRMCTIELLPSKQLHVHACNNKDTIFEPASYIVPELYIYRMFISFVKLHQNLCVQFLRHVEEPPFGQSMVNHRLYTAV